MTNHANTQAGHLGDRHAYDQAVFADGMRETADLITRGELVAITGRGPHKGPSSRDANKESLFYFTELEIATPMAGG